RGRAPRWVRHRHRAAREPRRLHTRMRVRRAGRGHARRADPPLRAREGRAGRDVPAAPRARAGAPRRVVFRALLSRARDAARAAGARVRRPHRRAGARARLPRLVREASRVAATRVTRVAREDDRPAVCRVPRAAFGRETEARLVDALRADPAFVPELSLVAVEGDDVVGHVLFTLVTVRDGAVASPALALAPLAVLPERQGRGLGGALVRRGLADAPAPGHPAAVALGPPRRSPRRAP